MNRTLPISPTVAAFLMVATLAASYAQPALQLETGFELSWPTSVGNSYQPQGSPNPGGPWTNLGPPVPGDGMTHLLYQPAASGPGRYQIVESVPGSASTPPLPVNGGFEAGTGTSANAWTVSGTQPPVREGGAAHGGSFIMRCALSNVGSAPKEGILSQNAVASGGTLIGGGNYDFSFWVKQVTAGPSYVQQYQVQWLNSSNGVVGGSGLVNFSGEIGAWAKVLVPDLVAPASAVDARIVFRCVTGAVTGGHGEVWIDDVALDSGTASGTPAQTNFLTATAQPVVRISWPTTAGAQYQPVSTSDLSTWSNLLPAITGDGGAKAITVPMTQSAEFFRLEMPVPVVAPPVNFRTVSSGPANAISLAWDVSPSSGVTGYRILYGVSSGNLNQSLEVGNLTSATLFNLTPGQTYSLAVVALTADGQSLASSATLSTQPNVASSIVALYNSSTTLEPATTVDTPTARITHIADRARDRHARESNFHIYDHYLSWYWEERNIAIEIIDRVAKGGTGITFNYTTLTPLGAPEFRAFFRGINTVAEYHGNYSAQLVGPNKYSQTLTAKLPENRPLQLGDRVEIEISQFLQAPAHGRTNYYGTVMLYIVGQGIVPWQAEGALLDSFPLPETAWLGGQTTLPYQYSNEPDHRFKQTAGNIAPVSAQPFMLGRRLHHTDFGNGAHSEPGNPIFSEQIGKLGPKFIARSCVECHVNNGRALPPTIGAPMFQTVMKIGGDAGGAPHPALGSVLQPQSISGPAEAGATIASYTTTTGQYGDGTSFSLRKPNYSFQGVTPAFFSARLAPPLVGMGLLEAVSESTITALADPNDSNGDGISGRAQTLLDPETGVSRLGRFTGKAGKARLSHQIASALNTDMGVTTAIFPNPDGTTTGAAPELSPADLDKITRYVALLGVTARRDLADTQAQRGALLFTTAQCVKCHTPDLTTGPYHPVTELRSQTIHPYTDLLLHDMGPGLADTMGENGASASEWRTPPLWSIGLTAGVSGGEAYLHDGRARSLEEAILWHDGEAAAAKETFRTLPSADRAAIIRFLKSL